MNGTGLIVRGMFVAFVIATIPVTGLRAQAPRGAKPSIGSARPDFQGNWRFATLTPLERSKETPTKEFLTDEEVAAIEKRAVQNQDVEAPPRPGDPGAYNRFWIESGMTVVATKRTSLVIDPPDGRLPPLTPEGQKREDARLEAQKRAEHPESLLITDRCIVGFNAGPPIIPFAYNQNLQIVQTVDTLMVQTEMVHDARVIPLDGRPRLPGHIRQFRGDSRGRWDGKTLVIETSNFTDKGTGTLALSPMFGRRGLGDTGDENLHLVERLSLLNDKTLLYEFTVTDPTIWTRPWTASLTMTKTEEPLYEYACHEANYGMEGLLRGARATEKQAANGGQAR
ncbi:MAG: hypothetical protein FJW27_19595 [Acidimicrobiia bacterium]|nr:hypothetical protein [Acidimicrobiia bacterium]